MGFTRQGEKNLTLWEKMAIIISYERHIAVVYDRNLIGRGSKWQ